MTPAEPWPPTAPCGTRSGSARSATTWPAGSPTTWSRPGCWHPPRSSPPSCRWCTRWPPTRPAGVDRVLPQHAARAGRRRRARRHQRRDGAGARAGRRAGRRRRGRAGLLLRFPVAAAGRGRAPGDRGRPVPRHRAAARRRRADVSAGLCTCWPGTRGRCRWPTAAPTRCSRCTCWSTWRRKRTRWSWPRCCGWPGAGWWWRCPTRTYPNPTWGHVRTFDLRRAAPPSAPPPATACEVAEHHGGWLVVDLA